MDCARELYGFPLAVLVGLSVEEQLAAAVAKLEPTWVGGPGSVLAVLLTALLGRLSWQLARVRLRESEAKLAHAHGSNISPTMTG